MFRTSIVCYVIDTAEPKLLKGVNEMENKVMTKDEFMNTMGKLSRLRRDEHKTIKDLLKEYESDRQQSVDGLRGEKKKY